MNIKRCKKEQITDELNTKADEAMPLCGVKIGLSKDDLSVVAVLFTSQVLTELENMAGYDEGYIRKVMDEELNEAVERIGIEVAKINKKAIENTAHEVTKSIINRLGGN